MDALTLESPKGAMKLATLPVSSSAKRAKLRH
jgi:hypothetical protein